MATHVKTPTTRREAGTPIRSRDVLGKTRPDDGARTIVHPAETGARSAAVVPGPIKSGAPVHVEGTMSVRTAPAPDPLAHVHSRLEEQGKKEEQEAFANAKQNPAPKDIAGLEQAPQGGEALKRTVKALAKGFYNNQRIRKGHVFVLQNEKDFSSKWMRHVAAGEVRELPVTHPKMLTNEKGQVTGKTGYADADISVLGK